MIGCGTKIYKRQLSNINPKAIIGKNCKIHSHVVIFDEVKIGDNVKIECFAFIPNLVTIEDDVFIGPRVTFTNDKYPPSNGKSWLPTLVKKGASIGAGAVIGPGITIGKNAAVGMGSVVTRDVPDGVLVAGVPAKVVGKSYRQKN